MEPGFYSEDVSRHQILMTSLVGKTELTCLKKSFRLVAAQQDSAGAKHPRPPLADALEGADASVAVPSPRLVALALKAASALDSSPLASALLGTGTSLRLSPQACPSTFRRSPPPPVFFRCRAAACACHQALHLKLKAHLHRKHIEQG